MKTAKEKLLVSFSAGRTSAFMAQWLKKHMAHLYEIIYVFANSGKERQATLEFARRCDEYFGLNLVWVEAVPQEGRVGTSFKLITFETAARTGEPFEAVIQKYGIPNKPYPHCTRELKERPIKAYARSIGWTDYQTAIGIRADEIDRMNPKAKEMNIIYPLIQMIPTTKSDVNQFWASMPFDLELKSYEGNCDLCWKKSLRKLLTLAKDEPGMLDWWEDMEKKYEGFTPEGRSEGKPPYRFFRNNMTVDELRQMAKNPIRLARDESKDINPQLFMFPTTAEEWDKINGVEELDMGSGCEESCEAFGADSDLAA